MPPLYPLSFEPVLKDYAWGGRNLETCLGRSLPPGPVAESWEISAHPNGRTPIREGALAGRTLDEVQRRFGTKLVGERNRDALARDRFPLLVKLLDAHRWLSVQVHPDDRYGLERHGDLGKTEMWVVLAADRNAELICGFRRRVDPGTFARAAAEGRIEPFLHRIRVRTGDVFFVPPGTIHALGPGLVLVEIQQASDLTFRLFDWNRDESLGRALHLEEAMQVLDFDSIAPGAVDPELLQDGPVRIERLSDCPHFRTDRLRLQRGAGFEGGCDGESFEIWGVLEGAAVMRWEGGAARLEAVDWLLLPADLGGYSLSTGTSCTMLRVLRPAARP